jgi:hypothetical protein
VIGINDEENAVAEAGDLTKRNPAFLRVLPFYKMRALSKLI